ncbi:hypothetical protein [Vacuolonema iberomarrocanum]|uniref:hypothetical protein n=1 Tax=Vacuolonema iberomarrocanum TaxID=3454632 RepID=UPI0019F2F0ED|nr:hypothetical protein [filamentous cyanobacterium LEGE 07170]
MLSSLGGRSRLFGLSMGQFLNLPGALSRYLTRSLQCGFNGIVFVISLSTMAFGIAGNSST